MSAMGGEGGGLHQKMKIADKEGLKSQINVQIMEFKSVSQIQALYYRVIF